MVKNKKRNSQPNTSLDLVNIKPITKNQKLIFDSYENENNLLIHGYPGTGKSFVSLYLSLREVLESAIYNKVIIFRSAVPTRDQGFMPGNLKEKSSYYEEPYKKICTKIFNNETAYEILKTKNILEFTTTSFLRSLTYDDCILFVDEAQNMSFQELKTIITRVGNNSKIIICGDVLQDDLSSERYHESSGLTDIMNILKKMDNIEFFEMGTEDIVRSDFVKEFIIKEVEYRKKNSNGKSPESDLEVESQEEDYQRLRTMEMFQA